MPPVKKRRSMRSVIEQFSKEKKQCRFCSTNTQWIDYKDTVFLRMLVSMRAKVFPRQRTGTCAKHQRMVAEAIKRARYMAIMPTTIDKNSNFPL